MPVSKGPIAFIAAIRRVLVLGLISGWRGHGTLLCLAPASCSCILFPGWRACLNFCFFPSMFMGVQGLM